MKTQEGNNVGILGHEIQMDERVDRMLTIETWIRHTEQAATEAEQTQRRSWLTTVQLYFEAAFSIYFLTQFEFQSTCNIRFDKES